MSSFLRNFTLDRLSFWIGFAGGILFWWFVWSLRPILRKSWSGLRAQMRQAREGLQTGATVRLRNDMLRYAQGLHLAAPLFSLDEIVLPPRVLAPPARIMPGADPPTRDITRRTIPYLPDWPQLAATYGAATFSLPDALVGGANLALVGGPGSGKTVALAWLAAGLARGGDSTAKLARLTPIFLHAADIPLPEGGLEDPLKPVLEGLAPHISTLTGRGLAKALRTACEQGQAILLLDGLDELARSTIDAYVDYLRRLQAAFPRLRMVVAASTDYYDGLTGLGLIVVPLAAWTARRRKMFIDQWGQLWTRFISPDLWTPPAQSRGESEEGPAPPLVEPALIDGWLATDTNLLTPFELTLKVWAAYAGDMLGVSPVDALEAYLRRMTANLPKARAALEQLATQMVLSQKPLIHRTEAGRWVDQFDGEAAEDAEERIPEPPAPSGGQVSVRRTLPDLLGSGLLVSRPQGQLMFAHPILLGYLAGSAAGVQKGADQLRGQPAWTGKTLTLRYLCAHGAGAEMVDSLLLASQEPLHEELVQVGSWLRDVSPGSLWAAETKRKLARIFQNEAYPRRLRAKALSALASSGDPEVAVLLRHQLKSPRWTSRALAALGLGMLHDTKAVQDLANLLYEKSPDPRRAACLALIEIGTAGALDAVASGLLHGDEDLRRWVAEAFANHPEEGFPLLQEGATHDDLLVRRAVVYGLARVRQPWAQDLLEKMQVEDGQWVVRNAATQALEELQKADPGIPTPLPPLHESHWWSAFAGERGLGLTSGKPAQELLHRALKEGTVEERLAAIEYLHHAIDQTMVIEIYHILYGDSEELREAAYQLLWHLDRSGIDLPSPVQFGLGYAEAA